MFDWNRREFLVAFAAAGAFAAERHVSSAFPVRFRQEPSYASLLRFADPGLDEFPGEKIAMEIEAGLKTALQSGVLPVAPGGRTKSPAPSEYRSIAPDVAAAVFGGGDDLAQGWKQWRAALGAIRYARFYSLPGGIVRYDIRGTGKRGLEHRVGLWKLAWKDGAVVDFEPLEETLTHAREPWFRDVTGFAFAGEPSFREQLSKGVPYWRSRLDPACGIDVYGENGIAAADIDGDGQDEIYVCQPGGLPNRLYKYEGAGHFRDVAAQAGLDILDDTASALFVDLRNSGAQDVVVVRPNQPMLFLNDGKGKFTLAPDAFRFASEPQGTFTSVSAADYDRDGRLDLYLCSYFYFQSEAQYRYPVPYHDARNGPPNYLFRNRLDQNPGYFEDVTQASGLDHNNDRFSFAGTWCDYNGDGWPDLYVANDFGSKNLYKNTNGHFHDVAEEAGVADRGPGMSAAWLDYDGDGRPDLLVSNMWSACGQRIINDPAFGPVLKDASLLEAYRHNVKGNSLYHNNGDGTFSYTGDSQGIEIVPWSWGGDGCDLDNDGTPEIYVACGMLSNDGPVDLMSYFYRQVVSKSPVRFEPAPGYENGWNAINQLIRQDYGWAGHEPNVFFARRAGRYYDFSGVSGMDRAEDSRAFAFTDFDGDGNLDVVLKSRLAPQVRVLQNSCGTVRKTMVLALHGTKSNCDAIGAKVVIDGQTKWLAAGSAYVSQHTKRLHFGLGDRERAEHVRIHWPSGLVQDIPPLSAGFLYEITEGKSEIPSRPLKSRTEFPRDLPLPVDNQARLHTTWLREPVPLPEKRRGPALLVLHAGEALPQLPVAVDELDLRKAEPDLVAGYAIFRRYLFDYRVDLQTPLWLLIDSQSRVRKVYADAPDSETARADLRSADASVPDSRALPFGGFYMGHPTRDYYKIGGGLLQAGYGEQALPYLEEMLRRTRDNPRALLAVGFVHYQAHRLPEARQALTRALALNPNMPEGWNELGGVESDSGGLSEALRCYQRALELSPGAPYALLNAARTQDKLGHSPEAEKLYRRALEVDPRSGEAANSLGLLLAKQGNTGEARKLFELAISIRRDDASAINNLGVLFLNTGQTNDAVAAFQYGIRVAPDADMLYMNLARVWVRQGDRDRARQVVRDLLARQPGHEAAQRALKELDTP
ncbi:MAG: FG-GAP-like repeat-containing protein [Bryobacteraceae bacterium]|nr:FG-GAP-like repeat-containing protein [Bryobacteraceae bacterium]